GSAAVGLRPKDCSKILCSLASQLTNLLDQRLSRGSTCILMPPCLPMTRPPRLVHSSGSRTYRAARRRRPAPRETSPHSPACTKRWYALGPTSHRGELASALMSAGIFPKALRRLSMSSPPVSPRDN